MKFIETADGWYIDKNKITAFTVGPVENGFAVLAFIGLDRWRLRLFEKQKDAEMFLRNYVNRINAEAES